MKTFTVHLRDATHSEHFEHVSAFVAEDASGSFGIRAHHGRLMTALVFGLARFRVADQPWQYLAIPGALLYFLNNELTINTRRYLIDSNYQRISAALQEQLLVEEENLKSMKDSLHRMEEEVLRRLWKLDLNRA